MDLFSQSRVKFMEHYKVHILVFLLAFLAAMTIAHPAFLITDEWVSANQLSQLNEGHQAIMNEGRYGSYENGTPGMYFEAKQNYLAYSLALPLISFPAEKLVYFFGDQFVFFILYVWIFLLIALALLVNNLFPEYSYIGKWRWTPSLIFGTFVLFFINLYFYNPYLITGKEAYPEIIAIVFTNIILFSFLAVMVFEICRTIFEDAPYAFFGTLVCLSCSSYLFWTNFCKDHTLVIFLVTAIILLLVKFLHTDKAPFLYGAFVISGLLAWARPELALFMAIILCIIVLYITGFLKNRFLEKKAWLRIFLSPLFTFIGAIPFFINNYLITHNIFLPAFINWNTETSSSPSAIVNTIAVQQNSPDTLGSLLHLIQMGINIQPSTLLSDIFGVFFSPRSGSMGVFPLVPLFLVMILLLPVLIIQENVRFTGREKKLIVGLILISFGILFAYIRGISGMNISLGMAPDMRYLSPLYLPLTLISLIFLKKIPALSDKPNRLSLGMITAWIVLIPLTLIAIARLYPVPGAWKDLFPPLDFVISTGIYLLAVLFLIAAISYIVFKKSGIPAKIILILLCATPLIWQIDADFLVRQFGTGLGGYAFWIPVVWKGFGLIF